MTMDIQSKRNLNSGRSDDSSNNTKIEITPNNKKRSFDVAFLMLPDDKKVKRRYESERQELLSVRSDLTKVKLNNNTTPTKNAYSHEIVAEVEERTSPFLLSKMYEDPLLSQTSEPPPRSAFSKVNSTPNHSPVPPLSPEQLSCPSASPPISNSPPNPVYFRSDYGPFGSAFQASKRRDQPPPPPPPPYIPNGPPFFPTVSLMPQPDMLMRNPATAAFLTTLLPTTMTNFTSLTSQNICAKCNISFRMTSDLVYHMRSHHKNDHVQDPMRRKREEKLRCTVCSETFRERHHLTRHMTAHQDKEGDLLDGEALLELQRRKRVN